MSDLRTECRDVHLAHAEKSNNFNVEASVAERG